LTNKCTYPFYFTFSILFCTSVLELNSGHEYRILLVTGMMTGQADRPIQKMNIINEEYNLVGCDAM